MAKMSKALRLEIKGLKELQKKAIQLVRDIHGDEIATAMRNSVIVMQRRAMKGPPGGYGKRKTRGRGGPGYVRDKVPHGYIPVDTGRLRASLTPVVEVRGPTLRGVVGTNVIYGPYQEFGTKRGVRALEYMKTTLAETREQIIRKFEWAFARIVKRRPK